MSLKQIIDAAHKEIQAAIYPKSVLATNIKTGVSIMDVMPQLTCVSICPITSKCYDVFLMKIRPGVAKSRARKHFLAQYNPSLYVKMAVEEIRRANVKSVRIYAGGDFAIHHFPILTRIIRRLPNVSFYMISKTLRNFAWAARGLLSLNNFFLNISEAAGFYFPAGDEWDKIRAHPHVNRVYTLMPDEPAENALGYPIVFNVSKNRRNIQSYKESNIKLCPCDSKEIPREGACAVCNKCRTKQVGVNIPTTVTFTSLMRIKKLPMFVG